MSEVPRRYCICVDWDGDNPACPVHHAAHVGEVERLREELDQANARLEKAAALVSDGRSYSELARAHATADRRIAELQAALEQAREWFAQIIAVPVNASALRAVQIAGRGHDDARAALAPPKDKCPRCGGGTDVRACTEGERCPVLHPPEDKP